MDNYELAVETAEKCCQANTQFAEISEVSREGKRTDDDAKQGLEYVVVLKAINVGKRMNKSGVGS